MANQTVYDLNHGRLSDSTGVRAGVSNRRDRNHPAHQALKVLESLGIHDWQPIAYSLLGDALIKISASAFGPGCAVMVVVRYEEREAQTH